MFVLMLAWTPMAFLSPFVAFLLWVFTTVMSPALYLFGFMQGFRYVFFFAGLALFALVFNRLTERGKFELNKTSILLILFIVHAVTSAFLSLQPNPAVDIRLENFLKGVALALVMPFFLTSQWRMHLSILVIALGLGLHGVVDGLKVIASGGSHNITGIMTGSLNDNNLYAVGMVMLLPLLLYLYKYSANRIARVGAMSGFLLTIMTVLGTNSRGGFLALAVIAFWYWLSSQRKLVSLIFVAALAVGVVQVAPERWFERIESIKTAGEDKSFLGRLAAWRVNMAIANDHPVFGGGFDAASSASGGWVWETYKYRPSLITVDTTEFTPLSAHSIYFQVMGDLGYIGLMLYLALISSAFVTRWEIKSLVAKSKGRMQWASDLATACTLSLVAFLAGGAGVSLAYFELVFFLVMLVALIKRQILRDQAVA